MNYKLLVLFISTQIIAQDFSWTGNGGDNDFFNEQNWKNLSTGYPPDIGSIEPSKPITANLLLTCQVVANNYIMLAPSTSLNIHNGNLNANGIFGGKVVLNENSYVDLNSLTPLSANTEVEFNSNFSWLRLLKVNPSQAQNSFNLNFSVFNNSANYPINIRYDNYYNLGTVIRPNNFNTKPLIIYSQDFLEGVDAEVLINRVTSGDDSPNQMDNGINSFVLKKGFMITMAVNPDGTGKSKVFIASEEDLVINTLPKSLVDNISFIRVIPWNWVTKKGTAGDINGMNNSWFYKWNNKEESDFQREFTPMAWGKGGADDDTDIQIYKSKYKATHVLGFNEPDDCNGQSGQYNNMCDEATALSIYENLMKTGLRLVSPAGRQGAALTWIDNFNQLAVQNDIRIDVIAVHWYDWNGNPQNSTNANPIDIFNRFKIYLNNVYQNYKLPIWVTEFNGNKHRTTAVNREFMKLAIPYLEGLDYIERYAWFEPLPVDESNEFGNAEFYDANNQLTTIGEYYSSYESSASIPESFYSGPDNLSSTPTLNSFSYSCDPSSLLSNSFDVNVNKQQFTVFPNPASQQLSLLINEDLKSVIIYNTIGIKIIKDVNKRYIDISDLKKGVYFIKANQYYSKFLKR